MATSRLAVRLPFLSTWLAALLIGGSLFQLPRGATAQPAPRGEPMSVLMLKRIAEAVDGHRTGANVWVVLELDYPHRPIGVFDREQDAEAARARARGRFGVVGPYKAPGERAPDWIIGCQHMQSVTDSVPNYCPMSRRIPVDMLQGGEIILRLRDGTTETIPLAPGADAVFLTSSAIDKFVMPYYTGILGVDATAALRQRMLGLPRR